MAIIADKKILFLFKHCSADIITKIASGSYSGVRWQDHRNFQLLTTQVAISREIHLHAGLPIPKYSQDNPQLLPARIFYFPRKRLFLLCNPAFERTLFTLPWPTSQTSVLLTAFVHFSPLLTTSTNYILASNRSLSSVG
jgi:hypothetical protein